MKKSKELIRYMLFGILTTAISIVSFQLFGLIFGTERYLFNNILSWVFAVAFAYVTNKLWVFESMSWSFVVIKSEIPSFLIARFFSLILEETGLYLMIDALKFENISFKVFGYLATGILLSKLIMQVIVVLSNYLFSKFLIFKTK